MRINDVLFFQRFRPTARAIHGREHTLFSVPEHALKLNADFGAVRQQFSRPYSRHFQGLKPDRSTRFLRWSFWEGTLGCVILSPLLDWLRSGWRRNSLTFGVLRHAGRDVEPNRVRPTQSRSVSMLGANATSVLDLRAADIQSPAVRVGLTFDDWRTRMAGLSAIFFLSGCIVGLLLLTFQR